MISNKVTIITFLVFSFVSLNNAAANEKIISAGGSITEILYSLGLGEQIIAVDSTSLFPEDTKTKTKIGYYRSLSAEGVLSLRPSMLVGSNGAGPDAALNQIKQTGVKVKIFKQEIYTFESWKEYILEVASYFNVNEKAKAIISRVTENLALNQSQSSQKKLKNVIFLLGLGERGPVAAGKNTVPNLLFKLAKMNNLVKEFDGFKPYSSESLIKSEPDLIVMPAHVVKKLGGKEQICQSLVIKLATNKNGCNLLVMNPLLVLGFGTRIDKAVEVLVAHER